MDIERNWKRLVAIKKGCENEKKIDIIHVDVSGILKKKKLVTKDCQTLTDKNSFTIGVGEGHTKTREPPRQQNEEEEVHTILNCISIILKEEVERF